MSLEAREKLWRVWWLWGIPVAWASTLLILLAELAHGSGWGTLGGVLDVARLLVYWQWLRFAWRCARNVANPLWTPVARGLLAGGLVVHALV